MIIKAKRTTRYENRYHKKMGIVKCRVMRIKLFLFGFIPVKTLHKYRETYYGEIKDVENCVLSR